jgi:hypothetical protein
MQGTACASPPDCQRRTQGLIFFHFLLKIPPLPVDKKIGRYLPVFLSTRQRAVVGWNRDAEEFMIHGLPAESTAAAACAAKAGARAAQEKIPSEEVAGAGQSQRDAAPPASGKRITPPAAIGPKAGIPGDRFSGADSGHAGGMDLTEAEQEVVEALRKRDREVRSHEQAHVSAGLRYVIRGAHYVYQRGPDGMRYAVGGDVQIDVSPVPGNPEATIKKAEAIRKAALAPPQPSARDRQVAAEATQMKMKAQAELQKSGPEEGAGTAKSGSAARPAAEGPANAGQEEAAGGRSRRVNLFA